MNGCSIHHLIEKKNEGTYYTLAFDVPAEVKKISISYAYLKQSKRVSGNIVDLGLEDPEGKLVGWSGSDKASVYAGVEESTPGYRVGPLPSGMWKIIVGAYRILDDGCAVDYEIRWQLKAATWYRGDLHVHTTASDGRYTLREIIALAKRKKLDFIALSNHNNYAENESIPLVQGLTVIPGVEWTHYQGHVNFIGITKPFRDSFVANSETEAQKIMEYAKNQGAIISVNHPSCSHCPYRWDKDFFSAMEIWNGPMRSDNLNAIQWWKERLKTGKRMMIYGGSDFHRKGFFQLGNPITVVLAASRSVSDLIDGLKNGHAYVTKNMHGPLLALDCEGKTFGDTVQIRDQTRIHIIVTKMQMNHVLRIQGNAGEIGSYHPKRGRIDLWLPITTPGYLFLEVTMNLPLISPRYTRAISNPIYFE